MNMKQIPFEIHIPDAEGESTLRTVTIQVPARWDDAIGEWVLTEEAHEQIENRKALEMGILSPVHLTELRERHGLTKKEIGSLFQVGEKSWNRWECGKHRLTRSMNLLIRALYDREISIRYLQEKAGIKTAHVSRTGISALFRNSVTIHYFDEPKFKVMERRAKKVAKRAVNFYRDSYSARDWTDGIRYEELGV
jgi:transcriptional regulator with XRE-family HTH domain